MAESLLLVAASAVIPAARRAVLQRQRAAKIT